MELEKDWILENSNGSIKVENLKIPSGVYTALCSKYGDVLKSKNDVALRWIAYENWTYSLAFDVSNDFQNHPVNLTLHGIDTAAVVRLNGKEIGVTDNMFVRYTYPVQTLLKTKKTAENTTTGTPPLNLLEIEIESPISITKKRHLYLRDKNLTQPESCPTLNAKGECHRNLLRKMQATFGGDSMPAVPSMGIWKPITLDYYDIALLEDIDVAMLKNETHWTLDIHVFLATGIFENFTSELKLYASSFLEKNPYVRRYNTTKMLQLTIDIPVHEVKLWWPNGYGEQNLYVLHFILTCTVEGAENLKSVSDKTIKIGFRTLELIEDKDDDGRTFYFKVNGHAIFIKGAVYMPTYILPENATNVEDIRHLLVSAKNANMNMLRVWAGGIYESNNFYNLADELGLLIWQDMTFTGTSYPVVHDCVETISLEATQNAKRLAYHPSLAIIVTNDEIELFLLNNRTELGFDAPRLEAEYKQLFMATIKHELNIISRYAYNPRPGPMISTPSIGVAEYGKDLAINPQNINYGDFHFWDDEQDGCDPDIYPRARFISEYGVQSLPIMSSWNRTIVGNETINDILDHRQHNSKGFQTIFNALKRDFPKANWQQNMEQLIYFSQISQAMIIKTATELFRSQRNRTMGAIYWHLNDVWVAPTWSSIDFYGNYKILYYWSKKFLAPITIIALQDKKNNAIKVIISREDVSQQSDARIYDVKLNIYLWSKLFVVNSTNWQVIVAANSIKQKIVQLDDVLIDPFEPNNCLFEFVVDEAERTVAKTYYFPVKIKNIVGIKQPELTAQITLHYCNKNLIKFKTIYSLQIRIKNPALFVYIEIFHPLIEKYELSDNGFIMFEPTKTIHLEFEFDGTDCLYISMEDVKILTMNQFFKH